MNKLNDVFLGDVAEVVPSNVDKKIITGEKGIRLCNYMDVYNNRYLSSRIAYNYGSATTAEISKFSLKEDDVIITKDSETPEDIAVPSVVIEDIPNLICGYHLALLRPKQGLAHGKFLMHLLQTDQAAKQFSNKANGSTRYGLTIDSIKNIRLNLPPLPTQRKIARILSTIDGQIDKTEAIIAKYQAVKQGMLQDLFTRGIDVRTGQLRPRYEDAPDLYQDSPLGLIPKEWGVKRLGGVADYVDYRGKTPPKSEAGIFLVTAKNVKEGYIDYEVSREYVPEETFAAVMSRGTAEVGDVLITTEAPMGNVAQVDKPNIALAQRVIKYRGRPDIVENEFLRLVLMSRAFQDALIADSSGSTVTGIKGSRLHKMKVIVPNIMEQSQIQLIAKSQEQRLEGEQRSLQKLRLLKQGLMQDLLSGKVAVMA